MNEINGIYVTQSKEQFIDVGPINNSKGNALKLIAEHYDIMQEEIIAFGDQYNDIPMLKYAGIGVAMGNAKPLVKENSDQVTLTNDEDGVFHKINEFVNK